MGQKVNPISNRLGIIRGWDSNWFGGKNFGDNIVEDQKIRTYLNKRLESAMVSKIVIERTLKLVTITICTARPGVVIGKGGQDVDKLKEELKKLYGKEVQINIHEVKKPELDATIVGKNIATQIEKKIAYRRAIKMAISSTMPMWTTARLKRSPKWDCSVSRYGSAAAKSSEKLTSLLTSHRRNPWAVALRADVAREATEKETITDKKKLSCYSQNE